MQSLEAKGKPEKYWSCLYVKFGIWFTVNFFCLHLTFKCCMAILLPLLAEFFGALLNVTPSPPLGPTPADAPPGRLLAGVSGSPEGPQALVPRSAGPARHGRQPLAVPEAPLAHHLPGSEPAVGTLGEPEEAQPAQASLWSEARLLSS